MLIKKITSSQLKITKKILNTCYVVTDKKHVFFDINSDTRILIDEYIELSTETYKQSYIPIPSEQNKIFYVEDTNKLYRYSNSTWIQIFNLNSENKCEELQMVKYPVLVATTCDLDSIYDKSTQTLTSIDTLDVEQLIIDTIKVKKEDRILVKNQTNKTENGLYIVVNPGSFDTRFILKRDNDFNTSDKIKNNILVSAIKGRRYNDTVFQLITDDLIILDETDIIFKPVVSHDIDNEQNLYIYDTIEDFEQKKNDIIPEINDIVIIFCDINYFSGVTYYVYNGNNWEFKRILSVTLKDQIPVNDLQDRIIELENKMQELLQEIEKLKPAPVSQIDVEGPANIDIIPPSIVVDGPDKIEIIPPSSISIEGPSNIVIGNSCPCCGCINYRKA